MYFCDCEDFPPEETRHVYLMCLLLQLCWRKLCLWIKFLWRGPGCRRASDKVLPVQCDHLAAELGVMLGSPHCCLECTKSFANSLDATSRIALYHIQYIIMNVGICRHCDLSHFLCGTAPVCLMVWYTLLNCHLSGTLCSGNHHCYSLTATNDLSSQKSYMYIMSAYFSLKMSLNLVVIFLAYSNKTELLVTTV